MKNPLYSNCGSCDDVDDVDVVLNIIHIFNIVFCCRVNVSQNLNINATTYQMHVL